MPVILTPHFTLDELTFSQTAARMGISNLPTGEAYDNVVRLAETLEVVRTILGNKPILISSGYRSPEVNAAVGGAPQSAHMSGLAADFTCPGFGTPKDICYVLEPAMHELAVDQLIYEFNSWVHLGLSAGVPRHMALTINRSGTQMGIV